MIFRLDSRPAGSSNNNGGGAAAADVGAAAAAAMLKSNVAAMPTAKDAEEYYCLRQPDPDENETGSSLRSSPDVVAAQKGKIITVQYTTSSESMAPGTVMRVRSRFRCLQSQSRRRRSTCLASQSPHPRDGIHLPNVNATPAPSAALGGGQRRLRQQRLQQRRQQLLHGRWQRRRGRPVAALPAQECHRLGQEKQWQGEHEKRVSNRRKRISLWH